MTDYDLTGITDGTTPADTDRVYIMRDPTTTPLDRYLTYAEIKAAIATYVAVPAASDTVAGKVELATAAETTTGTDATRAVTPDGLAGSDFGIKSVSVEVFSATATVATGDGLAYFPIPAALDGFNLIRAHATVFAKSTSGTPTVQIARGRKANATSAHTFADMLSTAITIDANEFDSRDATTAPVVNASNDDVAAGDLIRADCDVAGTGTTGLWITLEFQKP